MAYNALPPRARVALATQVKGWAEKAITKAQTEPEPPPAPNDFASNVVDTDGRSR